MEKSTRALTRQIIAAVILSALAVAAMMAAAGGVRAADLSVPYPQPRHLIAACPAAQEIVVLFDEKGVPTVPARTPYFYCVTGTTLLPGQIPPPPEYCCH